MISKHLELLMECPDQEVRVGVDLKLPFWGKNREIGINRKICRKYEKGNLTIFIIEIHVLAKLPNFQRRRLI